MKLIQSTLLVIGLLSLMSCGGNKARIAEISTEFGNMKVELYDNTPLHRDNFVKLVNEGFYNDLLFHRIIKGFMIQGGDPNSKDAPAGQNLGSGGPGYTIDAEIGAPHFKGCLAAARLGAGNPEKKSSGSQFYIVEGTPQREEALKRIGAQKGFEYNEAQIAKYVKLGGTPQLDNDYTVFGEIIEGMDVIDKIAAVATQPGDRPIEDVKMTIKMLN